MSVSHEDTPGGTPHVFQFGNYHTQPVDLSSPEPQIIEQAWFGINGVGHITGGTGGRDLTINAIYRGAASLAAFATALALDADKAAALTGALTIDSVSYGNATFLGVRLLEPPMPDGKNGLWFARAQLKWRLRS